MSLLACGINHKTAPLALRERLHFYPEHMSRPLIDLTAMGRAREVAILSTCNRTELYCHVEESAFLLPWLCQQQQLPQQELHKHMYFHHDEAAVRHMLRVASGLDSMVLGEVQILGQMKSAFAIANQVGTVGPLLQRLFQFIFAVTKRVRTDTQIGANPVSIATTAIAIAKKIFADLHKVTILLIGAGETIELIVRYLADIGIRRLIIANRSMTRSRSLAEKFQGEALDLAAMPDFLPQADMVIAATNSPIPILGKGSVERALKMRKHKPMCIIDLAVPRDVEAEVAKLANVYLYNIDALQGVVDSGMASRQVAAAQAEKMIDQQAARFMSWMQYLNSVSMIRAYREKMQALAQQELIKALNLLEQGKPAKEVLTVLTHKLTNKFMHTPTVKMRQAGYDAQLEILRYAQQLFDLE